MRFAQKLFRIKARQLQHALFARSYPEEYLGDTLETLQRVYAHWMRDDRDVPADALDRILRVGGDDAVQAGAAT